jgi:hypothetical protein
MESVGAPGDKHTQTTVSSNNDACNLPVSPYSCNYKQAFSNLTLGKLEKLKNSGFSNKLTSSSEQSVIMSLLKSRKSTM